jgi:DUF1680 family protein
MDSTKFSKPISLKRIQLDGGFWKPEMELVRKEVIPYQWETLNDRVPEAAPSYCMHNFKVAGRMNKEKRELGSRYQEPTYTFQMIQDILMMISFMDVSSRTAIFPSGLRQWHIH